MIQIPTNTPLHFMWLGKETSRMDDWIHYSRRLQEYELMIVDYGTLYIADEHGKYEVSQGEYILMSPCEHQHGWKASSCSFYWLHFEIPVDTFDSDASFFIPKKARIPDASKIQTFLSQIYHNEQFYSDTTQSSFLLSALFLEIHNQLYRSTDALKGRSAENGVSLQKTDLCKKIKTYIHWNRTRCIRVSEIASYLRYSEKHLSAVFSEVTGVRLKHYIDEQQMEAAKELLSNSKNSISEISFHLGYSDSHNFSRTFRRITGMSPKEYRISAGVNNTRP